MTTYATLDELKAAAKDCRDLDSLVAILDGDDLELLANRPESEDNISWLPTFGGEDAGDGGEGWEVLSWDEARIVTMHRDYGGNGHYLRVNEREG